MALSDEFKGLFATQTAFEQLAALGSHVSVDSFSLTTTSLRHLSKWFDRLDDINSGSSTSHSNFYTDPASIGLVEKKGENYQLTDAGNKFLSFKEALYEHPEQAEYELLKLLYFQDSSSAKKTKNLLQLKRNNLYKFLSLCSPTPSKSLILHDPKLIAIAEILAMFDGALIRFLRLPEEMLQELSDLSTAGFESLVESDTPTGIQRIARKIGEDYSRAPQRRTNYLFSMLILEIVANMQSNGDTYQALQIPYPFCNLITEQDLYQKYDSYTSDISIENVGSEFIVTLTEEHGVTEPSDPRGEIQITERTYVPPVPRTRLRSTGGKYTSTSVRKAVIAQVLVDLSLGLQAENHVESKVLRPKYGEDLVRVGHTNLELAPLEDGLVPGADFYIKDAAESPIIFIEAKATKSDSMNSITLTAGEVKRMKKCTEDSIPYQVYLVCYGNNRGVPEITQLNGVDSFVSTMNIEDAKSIEIPISY